VIEVAGKRNLGLLFLIERIRQFAYLPDVGRLTMCTEIRGATDYQFRIGMRVEHSLVSLKKSQDALLGIEAPDKENAIMVAGENLAIQDTDPDYPALVLGNFMIGGGFLNSRLAVRIRQKEGLSYGVGSSFSASAFDKVGGWMTTAIYAPQNADKLLAAFKDEISRALDKGFTPEELAEAKKGWLQSRQVSRSQDRELVRTLAQRSYQGRTLAYDADLESKIEKLSAAEVQAALKRHLDPSKIAIVISGDFEKGKKVQESGKPADTKPPGGLR